MKIPEVKGYGDLDVEDFSSYLNRWPKELDCIPKCIIENWIYRHWQDFECWIDLKPQKWKYELLHFRKSEILKIDHFGDWIETMDRWGEDLLRRKERSKTWLGKYMLKRGAAPVPIIVAKSSSHRVHPKGFDTDYFKEPYHLIEGHLRLSYLRGMIHAGYKQVEKSHKIWVVEIL